MALHPDFPSSPFATLDPSIRWFPADETLRDTSMEKLIPPLVANLRKQVRSWRESGYAGASETSRTLLNHWFHTMHLVPAADGDAAEFEYYFAQQEAVETMVYLHDLVEVRDKYDLLRFDSSEQVSGGMFAETWPRFVIKMATGSGKTKVLSLAIAWSYFHKLYEENSQLSRNFLLIAPNIIVLDRLYKDFKGLNIFYNDPVLPPDGTGGRNWRSDFQLTLHLQDDVHITRPVGNIFLSNIHRIYSGEDIPPTAEDENSMEYFLGPKPVVETTDSKVDLGMIVRDISELMVLNDEAHHIHDDRMAWFKSIEDIHNRLKQKGTSLSLQVDVTATPRHNNGAIFVQTISDYPLVEAISQNVVKHPVLPDEASRGKLSEKQSARYTEKYADYLHLGVIEWRKAYAEHRKMGKKAVLFVMTDDTRNCDEVAEYLEDHYADLKDAVLVIHTNKNGEISESQNKKNKDELEKLRKLANEIDHADNPYLAIVSVMMLKEGWDVRNVTTIIGLRAYSASSNILPEQTLGRGLRKMYPGDTEEYLSVVGTDAFMDFVSSIQNEGVILERRPMGEQTAPKAPVVVEVDKENMSKDLDKLDIEIPVLSPRVYREYKNLNALNLEAFSFGSVSYRHYLKEQQREIVFRDVTTLKKVHSTVMDSAGVFDYRSVIGYFTNDIMGSLKLIGGYDVLYPKVKLFIRDHLFGQTVDLEDANTLRNLSDIAAIRTIRETFQREINALTISDKGTSEIRDSIKLSKTRPFTAKDQGYVVPKKSVFNRVIGDSHLELLFANFLEKAPDVLSYAKNYFAVHFKLDYVNADGNISDYYPDFIVRITDGRIFIVETKGLEDLDVPLKMARLKQWCEDLNNLQGSTKYDFVFVGQEGFETLQLRTFEDVEKGFRKYKE